MSEEWRPVRRHCPNCGKEITGCRNSKGDIVPLQENDWAEADEEPTHIIIWVSSSCGEAFYGGLGNTFWVDNFELIY